MEEPPVEAAGLELAHRPAIAVGEDRLRAVGRAGDRREPLGDGVEGLVPGDPLEPALRLSCPTRFIGWSKPIGAVDPVEEPGHLLAEEPAREGVIGVAPQLDRHAVADRHEHAARVGAIERADVLDHGQ